jgi:hypothetical protein
MAHVTTDIDGVFWSDVENSAGSNDMAVDGSGTPVLFTFS